ncbi:MAG: heavy-metal-associated domain-containing protein [Flavobacterium sp.]|nr:heavy-metal-associated domain-containing protein [Flavobacterium sp.]
MNTFAKIVIIILLFASSNGIAQDKKVQKAVIKTSIECDHCKECETCGGLLEKTLLKTTGIQMITLDQEASTITVIYNTKKTDLDKIRLAISKLGYDADDVKADAVAFEKLDGCCKA